MGGGAGSTGAGVAMRRCPAIGFRSRCLVFSLGARLGAIFSGGGGGEGRRSAKTCMSWAEQCDAEPPEP